MTEPTKLQLAINQAYGQLARSRMMAAGHFAGIDAKRENAWCEYGYKDHLTFDDYYKLYSREGIAHGAIHRIAEKCWESAPEVIEGREQDKSKDKADWERKFDKLAKRLRLWQIMEDADARRMVGHWSAILVQVADSKGWDKPLGKISEKQIVKLIPAWEHKDLQVQDWADTFKTVPKSFIYGGEQVIHPDRVIIIGDLTNSTSMLKAGYNAAVNLEKIVGGSGESFLKNAARQLVAEYDKDVDLESIARANGLDIKDLQQAFDQHVRNINAGIDALAVMQGGTLKPLVAQVPQPKEHFDIAIQTFASSMRMPSKILVGNQTGERASVEDIRDFNGRCMGRRIKLLSGDIETVCDWLMNHGALEYREELTVIWTDLNEQSLSDKLDSVQKMVDANQKMLGTGVTVFTEDEIRQVAGYDAKEQEEPLGETEE